MCYKHKHKLLSGETLLDLKSMDFLVLTRALNMNQVNSGPSMVNLKIPWHEQMGRLEPTTFHMGRKVHLYGQSNAFHFCTRFKMDEDYVIASIRTDGCVFSDKLQPFPTCQFLIEDIVFIAILKP